MAQVTVLELIANTGSSMGPTIRGVKRPAAGYYLGNANLQTVSYNIYNLTADITIQASLANDPTSDTDWFDVYSFSVENVTTSSFTNIQGSYVWLRVFVENFTQGNIQFIKVSY